MMRFTQRTLSILLVLGLPLAGCSGSDGKNGVDGQDGQDGIDGKTGTKGMDGTDGKDGATGATGPAGTDGADGTSGVDGATGPTGAAGPTGPTGATGDSGVVAASANGTVVNALTNSAISGATVTLSPSIGSAPTTDSSGNFSLDLPIGKYTVAISAPGYNTSTSDVTVVAGAALNLSASLTPTSRVTVNAGSDKTGDPGSTVSLSTTVTAYDGSTTQSYTWTQVSGVPVNISGGDTASPTITLASSQAYRAALVEKLAYADRAAVLGVNPYAIEEASIAVLRVTVKTSGDLTYTDTVNVVAQLGLSPTTGLKNVALGVPQLLQAKSGATSYSWSVTTKPGGANPTLRDATTRWPVLVPDLTGAYVITEASTGATIDFSVGKWGGAISGMSPVDGRPLSENCTSCHAVDGLASGAAYFENWRNSGHAEIFSQNVNQPGHHWTTTGCASCHTVGYDATATALNDGFDDFARAANWTPPAGAASNYADMFASGSSDVRRLAYLANVQCENCHGPQNSIAHAKSPQGNRQRLSLGAELCGSCHGEPLRHGRFQQWQLSGHSNFELALDEATIESRTGTGAAHCGRCHSAEGFIAWVKQNDFSQQLLGPGGAAITRDQLAARGMTQALVHPPTCAACHEAHQQGTTSTEPNTANMRVEDAIKLTPAGFPVSGTGHGALCIACHNTRNGAHNDLSGNASSFGGPHAPAQGDVLLGENAYFVVPGARGPHSYITNTCTNCHMQLTPPPELLSYNKTGTNHSFKASLDICSNCHGAFDGGSLQAVTTSALSNLATKIAAAVKTKLNGSGLLWLRAQNTTTLLYSSSSSSTSNVSFNPITNPVTAVELLPTGFTVKVTLTNPINITWTDSTTSSTSSFNAPISAMKLDDGSGTTAGTTLYTTAGNLYRALWNYTMVTNDGSKGIHNPGFTRDVLSATMTKDLSQ